MQQTKKTLVALALVMAVLCPLLASCGGGPSASVSSPIADATTPTDTPAANKWEDVAFHNEVLHIAVSVNQDSETTFPAQDIYIKGPDKTEKDDVVNMVYNRNRYLTRALELQVSYIEVDLAVNLVLDDVARWVQSNAPESPDIYNNDAQGLSHAMVLGYLWNVKDPGFDPFTGTDAVSYFDFDMDCWYSEWMAGATMDDDKWYLMAGNAFLDIIRFAWVLYVNMDLFDETFASGGYNTKILYELVRDGEWDYDTLRSFVENGYRESGDVEGADPTDTVVGINVAHLFSWVCTWTSGLDVVQHKNGVHSIIENNAAMYTLSENFSSLWNTPGVHNPAYTNGAENVLAATRLFLNKNVLFAISVLGEMESAEVRDADFAKGLVPIPKFDLVLQPDYHTAVHNQAEIASILNNADHFSAASAYLQLMCEQSEDILTEYYESTLKYKYNDARETREMIDLVHDSIDSPFIVLLSRILFERTTDEKTIWAIIGDEAKNKTNSFQSSYDAYYDQMKLALEGMVADFEALE